ncbi:MAG: RagB/SusD family nutrient uptake outer membrane protein [Williamsia sp.]|nr:RagB/SusD family nutrient uptake outer membrane protein [Williamsia sp.]
MYPHRSYLKKFLVAAGICAVLASCTKSGFLENKTTALNETLVFKDSLLTIQFLNGVYNQIGFTFNKGRWDTHGNTEHSTDDGEYSLSATYRPDVILYNGTVSPTNYGTTSPTLADAWNIPYTNIRRCNLLMKNLPVAPLSASIKSRMRGEARCLRAWYYLQLLICYGGVPNVQDNVYGIDDIINMPRQPFAELVTYLSTELDEAMALLPAPGAYDAIDYGRVTKGTCMGLKSRLLLYAASPLFNGGANTNNATAAQIAAASYPTFSAARWQAAADAAQAVISAGYFSLLVDDTKPGLGFYRTFNTRINPEFIFAVYRPVNKDFENYYLPTGLGSNYTRPTHNLAVAFPMKNGKAITDPASGYDSTRPYTNRDPRFNYTIIYNGARYASNTLTQIPIYNYNGGSSTTTYLFASTPTGYWSRKMCDSTITASAGSSVDHEWPLMRYAEILLNYAEAINETGQPALAYPKLVELRRRAGIDAGGDGLYGMKANMTQAEMRTFIQNERRIELAFEDHRWNDIRRWKIAMTLYNGGPTGYNSIVTITRVGTTGDLAAGTGLTFRYAVGTTTSLHTFRPEMYLLPIQDVEIRKMPAMVQNPGW